MRRLAALLLAALLLGGACSSDGDDDGDGAAATTTTTAVGGGTAPPATDVPSVAATPLPEGRTEIAGAVWEGRIALAGGFTADGRPSPRLDLFDLSTRQWTRGPDLPGAYDHASLAVLGERLWLVGGSQTREGRSGPTAEVYSLGADETVWKQEASLNEPRTALATVSSGGLLMAIGGAGAGGALRSTEIYGPADGRWRLGPELATAREHTAAASVGRQVFAIAGRQGSLESNLQSVEQIDILEDEWAAAPDLNHTRGGIAAAAVGDRPCVAGGEEPGRTIDTVECLVSGRWQVVARLQVPRHGVAVVAVGNELHVLGGGTTPGLSVSDAHEVFEL